MGAIENLLEELGKRKLLVYFVILWGAFLVLETAYGVIEYGFHWTDSLVFLDWLFHFSELFAGLILILLGIRLLKPAFLGAIRSEKLLVIFLILWGASFLFYGLIFIFGFGPRLFEEWQNVLGFLGSGLAAFFAGVALELFSWKMLTKPQKQAS